MAAFFGAGAAAFFGAGAAFFGAAAAFFGAAAAFFGAAAAFFGAAAAFFDAAFFGAVFFGAAAAAFFFGAASVFLAAAFLAVAAAFLAGAAAFLAAVFLGAAATFLAAVFLGAAVVFFAGAALFFVVFLAAMAAESSSVRLGSCVHLLRDRPQHVRRASLRFARTSVPLGRTLGSRRAAPCSTGTRGSFMMRCPMAFRAVALVAGVFLCGVGSACHEGASPPAVSPSLGVAGGTRGDLDIGAPAIRFSMKPEPTLALTASDGTGLRLAAMTAQAVVDGSVAFTELRLTFDNPESRTLEGRFKIALPAGASLQRFAMKIGNMWQESEVVELTAAREAYEDALHRKQDPALLENAAGNEFSARVFPIPANARKELVISYVQELRQPSYVLPLRGLPEVGRLDAQVTVVGSPKQPPRMTLEGDKPTTDFIVDVATGSADKITAIRSGELVVARVKPQAESKPDPLAATIVLVDTSASRGLGFEEELRSVALVVSRAAAAKGQLTVATFDQEVTPIFDGAATAFGDADMAKVRNHGALGASNLQRALEWAGATAKKSGKKRVVLVTDGVATAGSTDAKGLTATVTALRASGIERVDAIATGGIRDDAGLLKLVRNQLPHDGVVVQGTELPSTIARRLDESTRSGIAVQVEGASWSWPTKLDGVQAGDEISIYAEVPAAQPVKVALDGKPSVTVAPRATARPLVERVVAQAQVASMLERELLTHQDLKTEITALAVRQRVLTPYTAMLVLETEADYARFHIDRRTPPVVLAIDDGKITRVARSFLGAPASAPIELADPSTTVVTKQKDTKERPQRPRSVAPSAPPPPPAVHANGATKAPAPMKKAEDRGRDGDLGAAAANASGAPAQPGAADTFTGGKGAGRGGAPSTPPSSAAPKVAARKPARGPSSPPNEESERRALDALQRAQGEANFESQGGLAAASPPPPPPPPPRTEAAREPSRTQAPMRDRGDVEDRRRRAESRAEEDRDRVPAYTGRFKDVMDQLARKDVKGAFEAASGWRSEEPADVMALIALGETAEALGAPRLAARAYGSDHRSLPEPRRPPALRGRAPRAPRRRRRARPGHRHVREGACRPSRSPGEPSAPRDGVPPRAAAAEGVRGHRGRSPALVSERSLPRRRSHPPRRPRARRRDVDPHGSEARGRDPQPAPLAGGSDEDGPSIRFVLELGDRRQRRRLPHLRRRRRPRLLQPQVAALRRRALRRRHDRLRPRVLHHPRRARPTEPGPTSSRRTTTRAARWATGWASSRSSSTTARANLSFEERPFVVMNDHAFVDLGIAD